MGLLWLLASPYLAAQEPGSGTVLIRNVRLVDRDSRTEDVVVSILIKYGKLDATEVTVERASVRLRPFVGLVARLEGTLSLSGGAGRDAASQAGYGAVLRWPLFWTLTCTAFASASRTICPG